MTEKPPVSKAVDNLVPTSRMVYYKSYADGEQYAAAAPGLGHVLVPQPRSTLLCSAMARPRRAGGLGINKAGISPSSNSNRLIACFRSFIDFA